MLVRPLTSAAKKVARLEVGELFCDKNIACTGENDEDVELTYVPL